MTEREAIAIVDTIVHLDGVCDSVAMYKNVLVHRLAEAFSRETADFCASLFRYCCYRVPAGDIDDCHEGGEHREYFTMLLFPGEGKTCPSCKVTLAPGERVWEWGEYHGTQWYIISTFCVGCFADEVHGYLAKHQRRCGCILEFKGYHGDVLPAWLSIATRGLQ